MSEKLLSRVGRIISGGFLSIVDALENVAPEMVLEKAIAEIDDAVDEVRQELGKILAKKHLANTRLAQENQRHEELAEKIEIALAKGREDLAEVAIAAQLDIEAQIPVLEATVSECGGEEKELEGYLEALLAKKRQMKEDLRLYRESKRETGSGSNSGQEGALGTSVESKVYHAESAFDRVMEKATGISGGKMSVNKRSAAQMAELEELARKNRIQERLAVIKSRTGKQ